MRLAAVRADGAARVGVVMGGAGGDAVVLLPDRFGSVDDIVRAGPDRLAEIQEALPRLPLRPLGEVGLDAPLHRFNRDLLCTGWNYKEHFEESQRRPETLPDHPTFFTKAPGTVIGPYADIHYDPELSTEWDYEAEIAVVIGRAGRSIPAERALEHVFGYCIANDVSQRDIQRAHGGQWMKGKSIDCTMPLGPWLTTADEIDDPYHLPIQCEVNGVLLQDATTAQIVYSFGTLIAELSWGMTLHPGDVILTGTPSGVGNAREPKAFLHDGDLVVTRAGRLGELRNRVRRTVLARPEVIGP